MSLHADALQARLADVGVHGRVSADGALAILSDVDGSIATRRKEIVRLAREFGFTHVALEIEDADFASADVRRAEPRA